MSTRLEHANVHVRDIDTIATFLATALPDFRIRHDGIDDLGRRWVHVGNDYTYVALYEATSEAAERWVPYSGKPGVNHLGYVVDDVAAVSRRLAEAGYLETSVANEHPYSKRVYFNDPEGNDWEFVEYTTDNPAERNDYEH